MGFQAVIYVDLLAILLDGPFLFGWSASLKNNPLTFSPETFTAWPTAYWKLQKEGRVAVSPFSVCALSLPPCFQFRA